MGFKKEVSVLTKDGYKYIHEIQVGDEVLNHNSEWKKVLAVSKTKEPAFTLSIENQEIETTKDQEFYIKEAWMTEAIFKKISDAKEDDKLVRMNQYPKSEIPTEFIENIIPTDSKDFHLLIGLLLNGYFFDLDEDDEVEENHLHFVPLDNSELFESILRKYNIRFELKYTPEIQDEQYFIYSKELVAWCRKYLNVNDCFETEQHMGLWILGLDEDIRNNILEGYAYKYKDYEFYFELDDYFVEDRTGILTMVSFFNLFGFKSYLYNRRKNSLLITKEKNDTYKHYLANDYESLKKSKLLGKDDMYDLTVEGENTYIVDMFIAKGK